MEFLVRFTPGQQSEKTEGFSFVDKEDLSKAQEKAITDALKKVVAQDSAKKKRTFRVRQVADDSFSISLGSGKEIRIIKKASEGGEYVALFQKKSWTSVPGFWHMVKNFFSRKKKDPSVLQQFHAVMKGFTYAQFLADAEIRDQIGQIISTGKNLEEVLRSPDENALLQWVKEIKPEKKWSCPCLLPLGNNRFLALFLTLSKKEGGGYTVSLYSQNPDEGARGIPSLETTIQEGQLEVFLTKAFMPMVVFAQNQTQVEQLTKRDPTLEKIAEKLVSERMESFSVSPPVGSSRKEEEAQLSASVAIMKQYLESLLTTEEASTKPVEGLSEESKEGEKAASGGPEGKKPQVPTGAAPQVPIGWIRPEGAQDVFIAKDTSQMVLGWLSSIRGRTVDAREALSMLRSLTMSGIHSQLKMLERGASSEEKIKIYERILEQIQQLEEQCKELSLPADEKIAQIRKQIEAKKKEEEGDSQIKAQPFFRKKRRSLLFGGEVVFGSKVPSKKKKESKTDVHMPGESFSEVSTKVKAAVSAVSKENIQTVLVSIGEKRMKELGITREMWRNNRDKVLTTIGEQFKGPLEKLKKKIKKHVEVSDIIKSILSPLESSSSLMEEKFFFEQLLYAFQEAALGPSGTLVDVQYDLKICLDGEERAFLQTIFSLKEAFSQEKEASVPEGIAQSVENATLAIDAQVKEILKLSDVEEKRSLLNKCRTEIFTLLEALPCPGEAMLRGECSFYECLEDKDRETFLNTIDLLQKTIFDIQMRLFPEQLRGQDLRLCLKGYLILNELSVAMGKGLLQFSSKDDDFISLLYTNLSNSLGRSFEDRLETVAMLKYIRCLDSQQPKKLEGEENLKKHLYIIKALMDPDYTVYEESPEPGVPFFHAHPEYFLAAAESLSTKCLPTKEGEVMEVSSGDRKVTIYPKGRAGFVEEKGREDKKGYLSRRALIERQIAIDDEWTSASGLASYVTGESGLDSYLDMRIAAGELPDIPINVLKDLFQIRRIARGSQGAFTYTDTMIVAALNFLLHEENRPYLSNPLVQGYLRQTLLDCPDLLSYIWKNSELLGSYVELIQKLMVTSQTDASLFLQEIITIFSENASKVQKLVSERGHAVKALFFKDVRHLGRSCITRGKETLVMFEERKKALGEFVQKLGVLREQKPVWDPKISTEKNTEKKEMYYLAYVEKMRKAPKEDLSQDEYAHILEAVLFLSSHLEESFAASAVSYEISYIKNHFLPKFFAFDVEEKKRIFEKMLPEGTEVRTLQEVYPGKYVIETKTFSTYELDLHTLQGTLSGTYAGPLPENLRTILLQAKMRIPKKVQGIKEGVTMVYSWKEGKTEYTLHVPQGGKGSLFRKINKKSYQFASVDKALGFGIVPKLLQEGAVWIDEEDHTKGAIFFDASAESANEPQYSVELDSTGKILQIYKGKYVVATDPQIELPFPFMRSSSALVLLDPKTKLPERIEHQKCPFVIRKNENRFEIVYEGKSLGFIRDWSMQDSRMKLFFGKENSEKIVIPVDGPGKYVVISYPQTFELGNKDVTVHNDEEATLYAVSVQEDGSIQANPAAITYMFRSLLQQVSINPSEKTVAEAALLLKQLMQKTVPSTEKERADLLKIFSSLRKEIQKILSPSMDPRLLALCLRFLLYAERIPVSERSSGLYRDTQAVIKDREDIAVAYALYKKLDRGSALLHELVSQEDSNPFTEDVGASLLKLSEKECLDADCMMEEVLKESIQDSERLKKFLERLPTDNPLTASMPDGRFSAEAFIAVLKNPSSLESISLDKIKPPLKAEFLIRNFLPILKAIRNEIEKMTPEEYEKRSHEKWRFLFFQSSVDTHLPPKEREYLKQVETEIRQLLLGFAATELELKNLSKTAKDGLEKIQQSFRFTPEQEEVFKAFGVFGEFSRLAESVKRLSLPKTLDLEGFKEFVRSLDEPVTQMEALDKSLKEKVASEREGKKFLEDILQAQERILLKEKKQKELKQESFSDEESFKGEQQRLSLEMVQEKALLESLVKKAKEYFEKQKNQQVVELIDAQYFVEAQLVQESRVMMIEEISKQFSKGVRQFEEQKRVFTSKEKALEDRDSIHKTIQEPPEGLARLQSVEFSQDPELLQTLLSLVKKPPRGIFRMENIFLVRKLGVPASISALKMAVNIEALNQLGTLFGYLTMAPSLLGIRTASIGERLSGPEDLVQIKEQIQLGGDSDKKLQEQLQKLHASGALQQSDLHALSSAMEDVSELRMGVRLASMEKRAEQAYTALKDRTEQKIAREEQYEQKDKVDVVLKYPWSFTGDSLSALIDLLENKSWKDFLGAYWKQKQRLSLSLLSIIKKTYESGDIIAFKTMFLGIREKKNFGTGLLPEEYFEKEFEKHKELLKKALEVTEAYGSDLQTAVEKLKNPVPILKTMSYGHIEENTGRVTKKLDDCVKRLEDAKKYIVENLPNDPHVRYLQKINRPEAEILEAVYLLYRDGKTTGGLKTNCQEVLVLRSQIKQLETAKDLLQKLQNIREQILTKNKQIEKQKDPESMQRLLEENMALQQEYDIFCDQINDACARGIAMPDLTQEKLPPALQPYLPSILYLQARLGIVLRSEQLSSLSDLVTSKKLLKQLRMGLGKTSILFPFALEILRQQGNIPIGIVPQALFQTNFDELDPVSRTSFELSGCRFLLSRRDGKVPLTMGGLIQFSSICESFLSALAQREYVLTTIESKATLDDKLIEFEQALQEANGCLAHLQEKQDLSEGERKQNDQSIAKVLEEISLIQKALQIGYKVKDIFEEEKARVLVDEADTVLRASYSVNFEMGNTEQIDRRIVQTVDELMQIIQDSDLGKSVKKNEQFSLSEETKTGYLEDIAKKWCEKNGIDQALIPWLIGKEPPPAGIEISQAVSICKQALSVSLRACLQVKFGVSADFDARHHSFGVPAMSGNVSEGTKFSDPITQYMLTQLLFMNKAPDKQFLKANAAEVLRSLEKMAETETSRKAKAKLQELLQKEDADAVDYTKELSGDDPEKILLRFLFAQQVVLSKLIGVSGRQITRSVQDALRGCNILGLTGTATQNLRYLVGEEGMAQVGEEGRTTTAEVLQRLQSVNPALIEYPSGSEEQLAWLTDLVAPEKKPRYRYVINQAGVADQSPQKDIVEALAQKSQAPVIYMCNDSENKACYGKKTVRMAGGVDKLLDDLSKEEQKAIEERGIFYYHTPYVRGTDFKIPIGSLGLLILSPAVNASDRDQAVYRARKLGAGHTLNIAISAAQKKALPLENPLQALLKTHHHQTSLDEQKEDSRALFLHMKGIEMRAIEEMKKQLVLEKSWKNLSFVIEKTHKLFQNDATQEAYIRKLERMGKEGKMEETRKVVLAALASRKQSIELLRGQLSSQGIDVRFIETALEEIGRLENRWKEDREKFLEEDIWEKEEGRRLPKRIASFGPSAGDEMSSSESQEEEEQQEEQQQVAESVSEGRPVSVQGTGALFGEIDFSLLEKFRGTPMYQYTMPSPLGTDNGLDKTGEAEEGQLSFIQKPFYNTPAIKTKFDLHPNFSLSRVYCVVLQKKRSGEKMYVYASEEEAQHLLSKEMQVLDTKCSAVGIYKARVDQNGDLSWKSLGTNPLYSAQAISITGPEVDRFLSKGLLLNKRYTPSKEREEEIGRQESPF